MDGEAFADVTQRLSAWADGQGLVDKAMRGVAGCFATEDKINGWSAAEVRAEFRAHSLCFTNALLPYAYVTTTLDLCALDGRDIGTYRLITTLDGRPDDDYLEIDIKRPA